MVNKDQVEGRVDEAIGKLTGNEKKELKGKAQKEYGDLKKRGEEKVDDTLGSINDRLDERERKRETERELDKK